MGADNDYDLVAPLEGDVLRALRRAAGDRAEFLWKSACLAARVTPGPHMTCEELIQATQHLARQGGLVAVCAQSLIIRLNTYKVLSLPIKTKARSV